MGTFIFKTNINCSGCLAKVTPFIEAEPRIKEWKVNIEDAAKPLTVEVDEGMQREEVEEVLAKAGFKVFP